MRIVFGVSTQHYHSNHHNCNDRHYYYDHPQSSWWWPKCIWMERDECTERICSLSRTADILQGRPQAVNASKNNYNARIYIVIRKFYVQMQDKDRKRITNSNNDHCQWVWSCSTALTWIVFALLPGPITWQWCNYSAASLSISFSSSL